MLIDFLGYNTLFTWENVLVGSVNEKHFFLQLFRLTSANLYTTLYTTNNEVLFTKTML